MGSVQKLATVVMVGLVGLATLLVVYLANEPNRRDTEAEEQEEAAIERGIDSFVQFCVVCHGPAGEGSSLGEGRPGAPLGGDTPSGQNATALNQTGVNAEGTPFSNASFGVGLDGRTNYLRNIITNGRGIMPAWGGANGQLNAEQIDELVVMIQHVDWDVVYNHAVETSGGYPTAPPPTPSGPAPTPAGGGESEPGGPQTVELIDTNFVPKEITITAGQDATVTLTNTGAIEHTFTIDALGIDEVLQPGDSREITINAAAGDYEYYCAIPGHKEAGMVGTLHVTEPGAAPAQPAPGGTPAPGGEAPPPPAPIAVELVDIDFVPKDFTIAAGQPTTVMLTNTGAIPHTFTIDALGIDAVLQAGESREITITADAGTYEYDCTEPGHKDAGMVGTLTVQ